MRTSSILSSLLTVLLGGLSAGAAETAAPFTAPGRNLALHKSYTLEPLPNYTDCSEDGKRTLLTDGQTTKGYFWVQKTTVGWVNTRPVIVTVDLGQVEPIAGVSYSTAGGTAGVTWPLSILVLASDDGQRWTALGDLVALSNKHGAPPPSPYRTYRFATSELEGRGRYVALVVDCAPYTVVDELEIYRGPEAWRNQPPRGPMLKMSPREYQRRNQVANSARMRMRTDLQEILSQWDKTQVSPAERAELRARGSRLDAAIDAWDEVPEDFTTVLPLNDLHARIYALFAPVLRARGFRALTAWGGYRYDMLQPLESPPKPPAGAPALEVRMMRDEHRAEVLNLTNSGDGPLTATVRARGLGRYASSLTLREVLFTDTRERTPVAAAILPGHPAEKGLQLTIPAGLTRQIWLDYDTRGLPAGDVQATLEVTSGDAQVSVPMRLYVADIAMPSKFSVAIGGWDETNNRGGYQVTAENMKPLIRNLREHGVNMPWSNTQVIPTPGRYDADGKMTAPPDFTAWDEWVERWRGARCWGLFPNVGRSFAGEPMGTPRFNRMVGAWAKAWVEHARPQGIKPSQIMLLLVDEPQRDEQDQIIIAWAKAIHAAEPELIIWNDPLHTEPAKVAAEYYAQSNVLCPNTPRFLSLGKPYQDFMVAQRRAGRELWFYSCSGPSKLLDPVSYYRGQFWLNVKYGGKGSCYWAFGDEAGFSWNAYMQPRACFSPLFLSKSTVTDGKQMEAIREGAEDYEYFAMLQARVTELESKGVSDQAVAAARSLLSSGPEQAVGIMTGEQIQWIIPKDRTILDRVRLQALELLERLP